MGPASFASLEQAPSTYIRYGYNVDRMASPLTPAVLHILMVLAHGEAHGYAIMKQVAVDSGGRVKMGPGTLYGSLKRMIDAGLVREAAPPADADDPRRVYYAITSQGTVALKAELERYRAVVLLTAPRPATS